MYITLMPVILAGILNMVFTKTGLYRRNARPIDGGRCLKDGRRVFGDNKTYIGFVSMIVFNALTQILWGLVCSLQGMQGRNELYGVHRNGFVLNLWTGALFGFAYMICELPNSFIKRRLDIVPGTTDKGIKGAVFFVVDQIDSILGVVLVLAFLVPMSMGKYCGYVALGGLTHICVNLVLYACRIRKHL